MKSFSKILMSGTAAALLCLSTPVMADCTTAANQTEAQKANKEIIANEKADPQTGHKEAATGAAKPTEDWFGCKPGSDDYDKCISEKGKKQTSQAAESEKSGKSTEKPAAAGVEHPGSAADSKTTSDSDSTTAAKSPGSDGECAEGEAENKG